MIYNASKGFEFDAIMKNNLTKKTLQPNSDSSNKKIKLLLQKKGHPRNIQSKTEIKTNNTAVKKNVKAFSFSKSPKNSRVLSPSEVNENRFLYNPRDSFPDPYELTHKKYVAFK